MKRKAVALIMTLLFSAIAGTQLVNLAKANYFPPPSIEIFSPIPAPDVHSNASVPLNVRVNVLPSEPDITYIRYSLDGKANFTLINLARENNVWYWTTTEGVLAQGTAFSVKASIDNLADGNHTLIVYAHYANGKEMSMSREFTVDTHYKPVELVILSPQNQTYTTAEVPLTFTINEPILFAHCTIDMKLALNESLFLSGNTTLTGLSNGRHTIKLVVGTENRMASKTINFTIAEPPEPFPTTPVTVASATAVVVVGVGLVMHFRKRKR